MNVLEKINKMRLERNWSVYRLSVESGVSQSTLTNMFNRETLPSIVTLQLICNAFGITLSEFFYEDTGSPDNDGEAMLREYNLLCEQDKKLIFELVCKLNNCHRP